MSQSLVQSIQRKHRRPIGLPGDFRLTLDQTTLRDIFGRVDRKSDRHRIASRLFDFKAIGSPLGIAMTLDRGRWSVSLYSPSMDALRQFVFILRGQGGTVQRLLSDWINDNISLTRDCRSMAHRLRQNQTRYLSARLARDWGLFSDLALDDILVDVALPDSKATLPDQTLALLSKAETQGLIITGEVGSGKTTLLCRLLKRSESAIGRLESLTPLYIPATRLSFKWGAGQISWESIPGVESSMVQELEQLFGAGKMLLLIDGVNENPEATDFSNPGVLHFWESALKNVCVIATLPKHYDFNLKLSILESKGKLPRIAVPNWQLEHYKAQFAKIIKATAVVKQKSWTPLSSRLKNFPVEKWFEQTSILRRTPLIGCAAVNFAASHEDSRLPRNEYELLDYLLSYHLQHQAFQSHVSQTELILGALTQVAVEAYKDWRSGGNAKLGERWCLPIQEALKNVGNSYALGTDETLRLRTFLNNLPFVDYNPLSGLIFLDQHFASFLVAKFVIGAFLEKDYRRIQELLSVGIRYDWVGKYQFQGVECLSPAAKRQFLSASKELFGIFWEQYAKAEPFAGEAILGQILQPLGYLGTEDSHQFLWQILEKGKEKPFVFMSAALALVRGGHRNAEDIFIEWLQSDPKGQKFIMQWRLFYERHSTHARYEDFDPDQAPSWEEACDWLLEALTTRNRDLYPLRNLYVYTICLFIQKKGFGPFEPGLYGNGAAIKAADRRRLLGAAMESVESDPHAATSAIFRRNIQEFRILVAKLNKKGGVNGKESKTGKGAVAGKETVHKETAATA